MTPPKNQSLATVTLHPSARTGPGGVFRFAQRAPHHPPGLFDAALALHALPLGEYQADCEFSSIFSKETCDLTN
jgi:hypothetical protein